MKNNIFSTPFLILLIFLGLSSCTDTTTDNVTSSINPVDTLFDVIPISTFTGQYDTLGYTLLVNTISEAQYNALPSSLPNMDSIRKAICEGKEVDCMEAVENYNISKVGDKVLRNGPELVLTLANGSNKIFQNISKGEDGFEVYQFLNIDENGNYVVAVFYYESYGVMLVNASNGKTVETIGTPVLSPDKTTYVAGNYDMVAAFTFNGLDFLRVTKDSIYSEARFELKTWGPEEIKWKDANTLYVKQKSQTGEELKNVTNYAAIRIRKNAL